VFVLVLEFVLVFVLGRDGAVAEAESRAPSPAVDTP
jgi:hypothetical protein